MLIWLILLLPFVAHADHTKSKVNMSLFFPMQHQALPKLNLHHHTVASHHHVVEIEQQSLKNNILRIAKQFGWPQVIWKAPADYEWIGKTAIQGGSIQVIFSKLLADYPLQAVFYKGNHVLLIKSRTLR